MTLLPELAEKIFLRILNDDKRSMHERNWVLNSIDATDFRTPAIEKWIKDFYDSNIESAKGFALFASYDISMCKTILEKWSVIERPTEGFSF